MKWIITPLARNCFASAPRRVCSRGTPEKLRYFEICHTCEYFVNLFISNKLEFIKCLILHFLRYIHIYIHIYINKCTYATKKNTDRRSKS